MGTQGGGTFPGSKNKEGEASQSLYGSAESWSRKQGFKTSRKKRTNTDHQRMRVRSRMRTSNGIFHVDGENSMAKRCSGGGPRTEKGQRSPIGRNAAKIHDILELRET